MTLREGEDRTFNVECALASWEARYPWRLERMAVLEKVRADASQRGHTWTARNVEAMLRVLEESA